MKITRRHLSNLVQSKPSALILQLETLLQLLLSSSMKFDESLTEISDDIIQLCSAPSIIMVFSSSSSIQSNLIDEGLVEHPNLISMFQIAL
jgi:hypothetical protein